MSRYTSPVNPAVFPYLTVVLLAIGMFFTAWFFVYEVASTKYPQDIYKELLISLMASLFTGFGVLLLLPWVGIYVCVNDSRFYLREVTDILPFVSLSFCTIAKHTAF